MLDPFSTLGLCVLALALALLVNKYRKRKLGFMHHETRKAILQLLGDIGICGIADTSMLKLERVLDEILRLLIETFPKQDKAIFCMRYFGLPGFLGYGRFTYREIAKQHNVPPGRAYQTVQKCVSRLAIMTAPDTAVRDRINEILRG